MCSPFEKSNMTLNSPPSDQHASTNRSCVVCQQVENDAMVECSRCKAWIHKDCAGASDAAENESWRCPKCVTSLKTGAYARTRSQTLLQREGKVSTGVQRSESNEIRGVSTEKGSVRFSIHDLEIRRSHLAATITTAVPLPNESNVVKDFSLPKSYLEGNSELNMRDDRIVTSDMQLNVPPRSNRSSGSKRSSTSSSIRRKQLELERLTAEKTMADEMMAARAKLSKEMWDARVAEQQKLLEEREAANKKFLEKKFELLEGMIEDSAAGSDAASDARSLCSADAMNHTEKWVLDNCTGLQKQHAVRQDQHSTILPIPQGSSSNPLTGIVNHRQEDVGVAQQFPPIPKTPSQPAAAILTSSSDAAGMTRLAPHNHGVSGGPNPDWTQRSDRDFNAGQFVTRQVVKTELPQFSGKPDEWAQFICSYESTTKICGLTDAENLSRLQRCLKGRAHESVRYLLLSPETVGEVIQTLRALYGRPEIVIHTLLAQLKSLPAPKVDKFDTIMDFALAVKNLVTMMRVTGLSSYIHNGITLQEFVDKLPTTLRINWALYANHLDDCNLLAFSNWLFDFAMSLNKVTIPSTAVSQNKNAERPTKDRNYVNWHKEDKMEPAVKKAQSTTTSTTNVISSSSKDKRTCVVCQKEKHKVSECADFKNKSMAERWEILLKHNLCRKCLGYHFFRLCRQNAPCGVNNCTARHHPLFHREEVVPSVGNTLAATSTAECNAHQNAENTVLFRIIPVKLFGRGSLVINTYAFLDDGSSLTLMEESLARDLELDGESADLCLKWTNNTVRVEKESKRLSMRISGNRDGDKVYQMVNVRSVGNLGLPLQSITQDDLSQYSHTKDLPIESYTNAIPRILIGLDNSKLVCSLKSKDGNWGEPIATKTRLGWTFHGCHGKRDGRSPQEYIHVNLHICDCTRDDTIHQIVKNYFSLENMNVCRPTRLPESAKEKRERHIMESTSKRIGDRFETGLLWRQDDRSMPNSFPMAMRRLSCLEKKMAVNPTLKNNIQALMVDYVNKGYARKLSPTEVSTRTSKTWYLPIFTVTNPNKPEKFRVVWDAAARVDGVSLNSELTSGPDQLACLLGVLYRFREGRIGITGDIREMFHQVQIVKEDQEAQRFLWRDDPKSKPDHYAMNVMTFGASCSPSSAQYIKNLNANEYKTTHQRAVDAIIRNHYVDDLLDSVDSEEEAVKLAQEVRHIHQKGGFEIRGWLSNSRAVLNAINNTSHDQSKNIVEHSQNGIDKVLGMWWCTTSDSFQYSLRLNKMESFLREQRRPTKREVLRMLMSIFDPLGLISFYIIYVKILMRDIWRTSVDWDDEINDAQYERWLVWVRLLPSLETIKIPRCYNPNMPSDDIESRQLHVFVDASEEAYAAVAFVRVQSAKETRCSLIGSKARVVPQQPLTIPRAELQAAVLGARLAHNIKQEHRIHFDCQVFWSDSKTVLSWLQADCRRFKPFVAFRVGEILETTDLKDWRWVPTLLNVADDATKWQANLPNFESECRWFVAPSFLCEPEDCWPKFNNRNDMHTEEELRPHHINVTIETKSPLIDPGRFSSWRRMVRVCAFVLRFIFNARNVQGPTRKKGPLERDELAAAERFLFRQAQYESFSYELATLQNGGTLKKESKLYKSTPYIDEFGVMRMRGRIDRLPDMRTDFKRPIILPAKHKITRLLITSYHTSYHHINHETVINEIRQRFDIPRLRVECKIVRRECQHCKNESAKPRVPEMGDLPKARLSLFVRPFTYVGVDFFGPMKVVVGRRVEKRYGMLFTCMTIRAIHIEIAHSLSTDSCIMCIRNFEARRGHPKEFFSDNGTNFHGTNNELQAEWKKLDCHEIQNKATSTETKWTFNPPSAPHMGGVWERLVRSVKTCLYKSMPVHRNPNDELLRTFLMEIELTINSRPLTYVQLDAAEDEALTPNHFLIGSSSGQKPPGEFKETDMFLRKNWRAAQLMADTFWKRWIKEYLPTITRRTKWFENVPPLKIGDIVLIVDENSSRNTWPKGIIIETKTGSNGNIRQATVKTASGEYTRPAAKLAVLDVRKVENGA